MKSYEEYKHILELWEQGQSKADIANTLGLSKYTELNKRHRENLSIWARSESVETNQSVTSVAPIS